MEASRPPALEPPRGPNGEGIPGPGAVPPRPWLGLRGKLLTLVLIASTIPVMAMGAYMLKRNGEILEEKSRESMLFSLTRRTAQVDEWLGDRLRELGRWSASFVLYEGLPGLRSKGLAGERALRDISAFLGSLLHHNAVYESLFVTDLEGEVLVSTRPEGLERTAKEILRAGPPRAAGCLTPVFRSQELGRPTLVALQPIQDRDLRTVGYIAGRIDPALLAARLGPPVAEPLAAFVLLDGEGRVVARKGSVAPEPGREPLALRVDDLLSKGPASVPKDVVGGTAGAALVAVRRLEGPLRGSLALSLPESVAYAPLAESRRTILVGGASLVLLVFAVTFLAAGHALRPVKRLSDGAHRMREGDLEVQVPAAGGDEIGELSRVFNEMARSVREGRKSLERAHDDLARTNAELRDANERLGQLAITDGLTGLFNHRHFQQTWTNEVLRAGRSGAPVAILMIDLDHFKEYNDLYGHTAGDEALRAVAGGIGWSIRSTDLAFRYGGEELAVILPGCGASQAVEIAGKIRLALRALPRSRERPRPLTVSIGVASFPESGASPREVLERADAALYRAKASGRNRIHVDPSGPTA